MDLVKNQIELSFIPICWASLQRILINKSNNKETKSICFSFLWYMVSEYRNIKQNIRDIFIRVKPLKQENESYVLYYISRIGK